MRSVESAEYTAETYETPCMRGFFRKRDYLDRSSERSERGRGVGGLGTRSGRSSSSIGSLRVGTGPRDRRSKYWDTGTLSPRSFFDTTAEKRGEKGGEGRWGSVGAGGKKARTRTDREGGDSSSLLHTQSSPGASNLPPPFFSLSRCNYFENKFPCQALTNRINANTMNDVKIIPLCITAVPCNSFLSQPLLPPLPSSSTSLLGARILEHK